MSTTFLGYSPTTVGGYHSSIFSVDNREQELLPDYVRRIRRDKGLSTTDVERQSGGEISDAYVTRIENGHVKNVSPEKLKALAKGLGETEDEIFAVARGLYPYSAVDPVIQREKNLLLWMYDDLPRECQLDVMASISGIHARRSMSAKISDRHEARAATRAEINKQATQVEFEPALETPVINLKLNDEVTERRARRMSKPSQTGRTHKKRRGAG